MSDLFKYLTGKTSRKIKKTKQKVRDVQALRKFKRGGQLSTPESQAAKRAASRLGDTMGAFYVRSKRRGR